ncbi:MAG: hypothetical protein NZL99_10225 [Burkholderiaceae bacterium]|nr:hypothetical protein [Burkholderiaceae bacterium]
MRRARPTRRAFLLGSAAAVLAAAARAQDIEVIALRHRPAEQVLPLLRPFLEPGGAVSGQGFQLFLRTSPENGRQLKALLAAIDRPPRELLITVRQERADDREERRLSADGGVIVSTRRVEGNVTVEADNARTVGTGRSEQRIRVMEGARAYIALGIAVPLTFRRYLVTPQGLTAVDGTVYYEAVTGFHATPRIAGELVTLELAPVQTELAAGVVESTRLQTSVQGRLGEWIAVGDADARSETRASGLLSERARTQAAQRGVWLKVDEVPPAR